MKSNVIFFGVIASGFLFSSLISENSVEAAPYGWADYECKYQVAWNNKRNQVKNKDRRKYINCLAAKLAGTEMTPTLACDHTHRYTTIEGKTALHSCIGAYGGPVGFTVERNDQNCYNQKSWIGQPGNSGRISDFVKDRRRRSTIACLENALLTF